jgi:hypothetical protein
LLRIGQVKAEGRSCIELPGEGQLLTLDHLLAPIIHHASIVDMSEESNWASSSAEELPKSSRRIRSLAMALILLVATVLVAAFIFRGNIFGDPEKAMFTDGPITRPTAISSDGYVGSNACKECHKREHETWHASYHRTMTQVASEQSVVGNFDDVELESYGQVFHLWKDETGHWVEFDNPPKEGEESAQNKRIRRQVVLCTGSHHMQVYWLSTGRGRELAVFPFMWLIDEQRWIPRPAGFLKSSYKSRGMSDDAIVQRVFEKGVWNNTCILCHTTHGQPEFAEPPESTVAEFGISCEACHGPGESHVRIHEDQTVFTGKDPIVLPTALDQARSSEVCGRCHSISRPGSPEKRAEMLKTGRPYRPGDQLLQMRDFETDKYSANFAWADGAVRVLGREFSSQLISPCYKRGKLSCFSCHQLHQAEDDSRSPKDWADDQLKPKMRTNEACLQCHQDYQDEKTLAAHTHHVSGSQGSQCMNCHMPNTVYGLLKATRSHQISNPSVAETLQTGRPNACNLCHMDKSLKWSGEHLSTWYGHEPLAGGETNDIATSVLISLRGDAGARALIAWHMGWVPSRETSGDDWMPPYLAILMEDDYDAVRFIAYRSLKRIEGYGDIKYDFMADPAVRKRVCDRIKARWENRSGETLPNNEELLISDGKLEKSVIEYLLRQRDESEINLFE